jgi:formate/nitrite transporter FocA (FNT family)
MAGAILALAAVFAVSITVQTNSPIFGAILFPVGLLMGGNFAITGYVVWNEISTVLGNLVGGLAFTGLTLYSTHARTAPKRAFN